MCLISEPDGLVQSGLFRNAVVTYVSELFQTLCDVCFSHLQFPGSADELDTSSWLSEECAARWQAALRALCKKLRFFPSAILYLHGLLAEHVLVNGFQELFFAENVLLDMLVLNTVCVERGGTVALLAWQSTHRGLSEFVDEFAELRK